MSFTVSLPGGAVQLSGNPINVVATTTTAGVSNHRMLFHIISSDGAIPYGPWTESVPVDSDGAATLDIHALVDGEFNYNFSKVFDATAEKVYSYDQLAANITIKVGESYIDGSGDRFETDFDDAEAIIATTALRVLKGGLSLTEYCILSESGSSFYSKFITSPRFLTRQQSTYNVPLSAWVKLWFISNANVQHTIVVTANYADKSSKQQSYTLIFSTTKLYEINTNIAVWTDITATNNGYPITSYTITVRKTSGGLGNFVVVNVNSTYYETVNEFYYVNSLSGVDLLYCTGELTTSPATEGETYVRQLPVSPTSASQTKILQRKTISRKYKCSTGFLSKTERIALTDFLSSPYVWWKRSDYTSLGTGSYCIPVIVQPGTYELDTTSDDVKSVEFEFEIAQLDKF